MANLRATAFAALAAAPNYPRRPGVITAGWTVGGLGLSAVGFPFAGEIEAIGGAAWAGVTGWWWMREVVRPHGTRGQITRAANHGQRAGGVASWRDVQELASPGALRLRTNVLRPSLDGQRVRPTELGVCLATVGWGWLPGQQVWSSCEDVTIRIGGPRTGKTLSLACHGLDAPGALVTTSTRADLGEEVHSARQDRAVHVMNVTGYGSIVSTVRWSILTGCEDFATASRRAADLIAEDHSVKDGAYWAGKARDFLAILLHAAALDGRRVQDIVRWATAEPGDASVTRIIEVLTDAGPGGPQRAWQVRQHYTEAPNTRKSTVSTLMPALAWLADDAARPLGDADRETVTLDVERLIRGRETLHLIAGTKVVSGVAALIAAIVAEVVYQARVIAGGMPGERLDPQLTVLLDEAALIAPVPLPRWTADMGGRNITLHVSIQSIAQMRERWGKDGAATIMGNVGAFMVFGGGRDAEELQSLSVLTGETRQRILDSDWKNEGDVEHRWVPVMTPAQISTLRPGQVLLLRRGLNAVVGWAPLVVNRKGWTPGRLARIGDEIPVTDPLVVEVADV